MIETDSSLSIINAHTADVRSISFMQLWRREWQVKQQGAVQWLYPLVLFLVIITLFPLAVGSEPALL
ncbi:MAG TPA: ABC transporter permease, partial [Psychrobacter sp.]|nr:ABC transporter permease [Psychrobacter sp.]